MRVLAIGAHPDDIEIGCGATLALHSRQRDAVAMLVMTVGERGPHQMRMRIDEQEAASDLLGANLIWGGFEDGSIPDDLPAVQMIDRVIEEISPDVIYTHAVSDTHQDHRAVAIATLSAARRHCRVLHYNSPTTIAFDPSVFVEVNGFVERKILAIEAHASQVAKNGLVNCEAIAAETRYWGHQARVKYAEAFEPARFLWHPIAIGLDDLERQILNEAGRQEMDR
jgi:LmbE family N-acetylglucosaminyl deacetylase